MKKSILLLFVLMTMSLTALADGLTATLQHGDKMTPYYGVDAFKDAYSAAKDSDVITLSKGTFNTVTSTITKKVKIVGTYGLSANSTERTILASLSVAANDVTVDGIYFSGDVTIGAAENFRLLHSWVEGTLKYSSTTSYHTNTIVDQCVIKKESAIKQGKNYTLKNSTIGEFSERNTSSNMAYITNCVVYRFVYDHSAFSNLSNAQSTKHYPVIPFAIYKNNVLGIETTNYHYNSSSYYFVDCYFKSPNEFWNNCFAVRNYNRGTNGYISSGSYYIRSISTSQIQFDPGCQNNSNTVIALSSVLTLDQYPSSPTSPGNGQDGTLRGPKGGTGFKYYPEIPRITSSTIDANTDSDGKLNVKINVSIP